MGCDIHMYREKLVDGKWVTADKWADIYDTGELDVPYEDRYTGRNYELFGLLSKGVREDISFAFKPRGLPHNCSPEVLEIAKSWGEDAHSHNYLYLFELKEMWDYLDNETINIRGMMDKEQLNKLNSSIESDGPTDWNLLYPYCLWGNSKNYVNFSVDVPAKFVLSSLKEIISMFDGVDGDNHRVVFWFDN